jgi:type IV pilus assembly protein PilQ
MHVEAALIFKSKPSRALLIGAVLGCVLLLLLGCARKMQIKKDPFWENWRMKAQQAKGFSPRPIKRKHDVTKQNRPPEHVQKAHTAAPKPALPHTKISLKMRNADLAALLRAMARGVNQNVIINDKVHGKVSIDVKNAPWDRVFIGLLRANGLTYTEEGGILRVLTPADLEEALKRQAQQQELRLTQSLITRVIHVNYADAGKLKDSLDKLLTVNPAGKPIGTVMVDQYSNSIIIRSIPDDIHRMVGLVDELDRPTAQILIEAQIVQTTQDTARELGVQWGALAKHGNTWVYPGWDGTGVSGSTLSGGIDPAAGSALNLPADLSDGVGMAMGFAYQDLGNTLLTMQLSALQKEGKLNILSSPSVTTLENQMALIEAGEEVPFQTVENNEVKIEFKKAVLRLEVTPHVVGGDVLKLKIATNKDELDFTHTVVGNPTIITRKAKTNVVVFDGQTTVIGGLDQETDSKSQNGVPVLQDVPLLGHLFKSHNDSNKMEDVLIFITPHILKQAPEITK